MPKQKNRQMGGSFIYGGEIGIYKIFPYILPFGLDTLCKFVPDKFVNPDTVSILLHTVKTKIPRDARYFCFKYGGEIGI